MRNKLLFIISAVVCFTADMSAQVNLQTGSATFSLPILEWKHDRSRLASNVAITYNSGSGLKVTDVASNIGQGWSLIAGGVITRLQVGGPDDQGAYAGNGSEMDTRKYPAGYINATIPAYEGCPNALTKYPIYKSKNQVYTQHNVLAEDKEFNPLSHLFQHLLERVDVAGGECVPEIFAPQYFSEG